MYLITNKSLHSQLEIRMKQHFPININFIIFDKDNYLKILNPKIKAITINNVLQMHTLMYKIS